MEVRYKRKGVKEVNKRSPKTVLKKETIDKRDEGNEKYFNKCKVIFSQEKYVSEAIKEDYYMKWTPTTPVFISAQTGAGKNTFIEKVLIEKMVPRKTKVLILSNRIALGRQEKGRLAEIMDRIEPRPSGERTYKQDVARRNGEMLDDLEDFGSVMIKSYQGLNASKEIFKKEYDYVIFDECHFFLADAKFNKFTYNILEKILQRYPYAIRVYMTATLSDVFIPIMKCELKERDYRNAKNYELEKSKCLPPILWGQDWKPAFWEEHLLTTGAGGAEHEAYFDCGAVIYEMERNYDHVCCRYLKAKEEKPGTVEKIGAGETLAEFIKKQIDEEGKNIGKNKWLIFVSSISVGKELRDLIGREYATLVTAKAKSRDFKKEYKDDDTKEIYQEICEKKIFSKKVVISTPVLDNGINIEDPDLKNIAILVFDKVSLLQMLGRKRGADNEQINLYIQEYRANTINAKLNLDGSVRENLARIALYKSEPRKIGDEIFERDLLFYWADNNYDKLAYNPFAEAKLNCEERFYEKMLKTDEEEDYTCLALSYDNYIRRLKNEMPCTVKSKSFEEKTIIEQLSWLGLAHTFAPENYVGVKDKEQQEQARRAAEEELFDFLEQHSIAKSIHDNHEDADALYLIQGMDQGAQERFKEAFKVLAINVFGKRENDKKKDRPYGLVVINGVLENKELPYSILSRSVKRDGLSQTFWLLVKNEK